MTLRLFHNQLNTLRAVNKQLIKSFPLFLPSFAIFIYCLESVYCPLLHLPLIIFLSVLNSSDVMTYNRPSLFLLFNLFLFSHFLK